MSIKIIPVALLDSRKSLYDLSRLEFSELVIENESVEYGACNFKLSAFNIVFRVAKITPKKIGQFVTLWKRIKNGPIQPYDRLDDIDFFVVSTRTENNFGQFIFPKSVLYDQGIISDSHQKGKLAIRVYPPWDISLNKQAQKTQAWQLHYFLEIPENKPIDLYKGVYKGVNKGVIKGSSIYLTLSINRIMIAPLKLNNDWMKQCRDL